MRERSSIWDRMSEAADDLLRRHGGDKVAALKEIGVTAYLIKTPFGKLILIERPCVSGSIRPEGKGL